MVRQALTSDIAASIEAIHTELEVARGRANLGFEVEDRPLNISRLYDSVSVWPKMYWKSRDQDAEGIAIGSLQTLGVPALEDYEKCFDADAQQTPTRIFGGLKFSGEPFFFVPTFRLTRSGGRCEFRLNARWHTGEEIEEIKGNAARVLRSLYSNEEQRSVSLRFLGEVMSRENWLAAVRKAQDAIRQGRLEKIVLARASEYHFDYGQRGDLLAALRRNSQDSFVMTFEDESSTFVSITPELLYRRSWCFIASEALAGTADATVEGDTSLLQSEKERHEHGVVVKGIRESLGSIGAQLRPEIETTLKHVGRLVHLNAKIEAECDQCTDYGLLSAIHPTPAVGVYPQTECSALLKELEGFERGWYAAPLGWMERNNAEFAVGIRSALLTRDNKLTAYAGAGIVAESNPEAEWSETQAKLDAFFSRIHE